MSTYHTMQPNLSLVVYFVCVIVIASMETTPNFVLASSKSSDNTKNNNTARDWNFYRANSHNLAVLNDTRTLKDCSTTNQIGPCWDSDFKTFVP
jgi:hypothetical protein